MFADQINGILRRNMFDKLYSAEQLARMNQSQFTKLYNTEMTQNFLSFIESRVRFELLEIIRELDKKGEISIEVRKKNSISAYHKVLKEIKIYNGSENFCLYELIKDFIGCRIICNDEDVMSLVFNKMLQTESFEVQEDGFELYSAPHRPYENKESRYKRLMNSLGLDESRSRPSDLIKTTNYESLHCYLKLSAPRDIYAASGAHFSSVSVEPERRHRYEAEIHRLNELKETFTDKMRGLVPAFPIECQIRTITEHLWAQEEHKYVYDKIKNGVLSPNDPRIELLRGAFTALKHAYCNIDDMREMVRLISNGTTDIEPIFSGSSKDISSLRTLFFRDRETIQALEDIDGRYRNSYANPDSVQVDAMRGLYCEIRDLVEKIKLLRSSQKEDDAFDIAKWGQDRIVYLLVAYMLLTSHLDKIEAVDIEFLNDTGLSKFIGATNMRLAHIQSSVGNWLASRIYSGIISYDRFAFSVAEEIDTDRRHAFQDPLVYVRHASSLFLQERFSEAKNSLDQLLYGDSWRDFRANSDRFSGEFSFYELYMRRNQYAWFSHFDDKDKILDSVEHYAVDFSNLFQVKAKNTKRDSQKRFRAYCWFLLINRFLELKKISRPAGFEKHEVKAITYVENNVKKYLPNSELWDKPEVLCAFHLEPKLQQIEAVTLEDDITRKLENNVSYPIRARHTFLSMMRAGVMKPKGGVSDLPKVFISYSQKDAHIFDLIVDNLQQSEIEVISDKDFIAGSSLLDGMQNAIKEADISLILITSNYVKSSGWLKQEREAIIQRSAVDGSEYIPVSVGVDYEKINELYPFITNQMVLFIDKNMIPYQLHRIVSAIKSKIKRLST